jgi:peptide/nickel transport system substrate-binding protein
MKRLGINVDFVATDWGTVVARRTQKSLPGQGGWQMFHGWHAGVDLATPMSISIRANGEKAWFGWPESPPVEAAVAAWFEAKTPDEEKVAARMLNRAALADVVYAPVGCFLAYQAWRNNVSGIVKGPLPFFWGVSKAA